MPLTALQRANTALDEGDTAGARAALLEAWQNARSPAVADLLGLLDARKPDELVGQLDAVLTPRVSTTLERFSPLARRDDPRVSAFALAALERLPFTTPGAQPLLEAFVRVVLERRDTRLLPRVKVIREGLRTRITRAPVRDALLAELDHAVGLLKNLQLRTSPEIGALEDSLRARFASLAAPAQSEEALLAAVYARPADDAPRLVYADWLLERGEERGEFITLQFKRRAGALSEAETRRERQLLKKHGKSWLGALAPVLSFGKGYSRTTFERGFISSADIILSVGQKLEPLWTAIEWTTVEHLAGNWPVRLMTRAPLRALRSVDRMLTEDTLEALRKGRIELAADSIELQETVKDWELVRAVFPNLRALAVWWTGVPTLATIAHFEKLGLHRLELRRTWASPRVGAGEPEFAALLEALSTTRFSFAELALMPAWRSAATRSELVELRPTAAGFSASR